MSTIDLSKSGFITQVMALQPEVNLESLAQAYDFTAEIHYGETRLSGEPFLIHPLATALNLATWGMYTPTIVAGLLHDVIEDHQVSEKHLEKKFGQSVARIVQGVSKVGQVKLRNFSNEQYVENLRKMLVAMSKDVRVILVKLADRLHNMQTLEYHQLEKQIQIARETLEVYAPLAARLGMGQVQSELEDSAFRYLHSDDYDWLSCYAAPYYEQTSSALDQASSQLTKRLEAVQVPAEVSGRQKHLYSLYKKLLRPEINRQIDKIYDLVALRVIVDNETDCYSALGIVHDLWTPVKEVGVRDYIAKPKQNGYQSIHTNVYIAGKVSEIQIRTRQMHGEAEYGVASHWHYAALKVKNKINSEDIDNGAIFAPDDKVKWVNRLLEVFNQVRDNKELMNSISFEVFNHRIFVYTPKGDVVDLPKGATPIDFAFAIHSDLGRWIQGVKVNGKLEPFSFHLQSGDLCEIIKDKQPRKASRNWLDFVVTNTARKKIKAQLRRAD